MKNFCIVHPKELTVEDFKVGMRVRFFNEPDTLGEVTSISDDVYVRVQWLGWSTEHSYYPYQLTIIYE